jgi:hypothetical protein
LDELACLDEDTLVKVLEPKELEECPKPDEDSVHISELDFDGLEFSEV